MSFFSNFAHPKNILGTLICMGMNHGEHQTLSSWALSFIDKSDAQDFRILDVGCGGGANLKKMSKMFENSSLTGIDPSKTSLKVSSQKNKSNIKNGRLSLVEGDVSNLPFEKDTYNLITAFECTYFFSDLNRAFNEMHRTLKDGGSVLIGVTAYENGRMENFFEKKVPGMKVYSIDDYQQALEKNGFKNVQIYKRKHALAVIAAK
ncbi:MAG: class I SAM-dependent methyltransferase [Succinivibrio sp.]